MTEDCMKLIGTEVRGSTALMLMFSLNRSKLKVGIECSSRTFNIHNVAEIRFLLCIKNFGEISVYKQTKKHTLAKELAVQLKVVSESPKFDGQFLCTEDWCEKSHIGVSYGHVYEGIEEHFQILIDIKVSKVDTKLKLYEDEQFTDFKLSTDEGSLAVHKAYLAANSDVFKRMLSQEWKETNEGRVQIEGTSLQTLKDLKRYIYLGTLPDNGLLPLLLIARYYLMNSLKAECLMKISRTVISENLYEIMEYSFLNKIPELMFNVIETMPKCIAKDAYEIMMKNQKSGQADEKTDKEEINSNNE